MSIPIEKIKYGTRVVITDMGQEDAACVLSEDFSGQLGTISRHKNPFFSPIVLDDNGWFCCTILFEDGPLEFSNPFYFRAVRFRLATDEEIATAEQKKTEPETPDLSCSEIEFLVVLESARKWYMLREHPEWSNEDYFKRFPKDPKLYTILDVTDLNNCSCCSLWVKKCGDGITNCPLDKNGLWCDSGSDRLHKKYSSGENSPWRNWYMRSGRRNAADKIFQAIIAWLVGYARNLKGG